MIDLRTAIVVILLGLAPWRTTTAQGFVNLDFESARAIPAAGDSYNGVFFSRAFPQWTKTITRALDTNALYNNNIFLDSAGISIIDSNAPAFLRLWLISVKYAAILASGLGYTASGMMPTDATLSQTGLIPSGTQALQFKALEWFDASGAFAITLGGQALALQIIGSGDNYVLYGANTGQ